MNNPDYDDEFAAMTNGLDTDPHPYGPNTNQQVKAVKPGLTPRGKAILGAAGVALAASGFLVYQDHQATVAAETAKAAEIQLQQQRLELERLKVMNEVDEKQSTRQKTEDKALQAKIDACVKDNKDQSPYLQGTVDACRDQYSVTHASSTDGNDMQVAGSVANTATSGAINPLWAVAGIAGAAGIAVAAKRVRRTDEPAPATHCH
ncbi:hypothetical protein ACFW9D_05500 [Streptomyces sp. NPDC059524]|uniref:hypothetical protein n=1 Tax=Streptomyces sp. NPDC059524 TaxID=3346856 RepID=UPI0036A1572E